MLFKICAIIENMILSRIKFVKSLFVFYGMLRREKMKSFSWFDIFPCLNDNTVNTEFDRHYVYHTAWAARVLSKMKPIVHVDISSSIYFSTNLSAFLPVNYYDYRAPKIELSGLEVARADLLNLPFENNSILSISCMHVIEHIGLGRYGDQLDVNGDIKAINELKRVCAVGGVLLVVVPIGKEKIRFNAHRIYDYDKFVKWFEGFSLIEFALVPDYCFESRLIINPSREFCNKQYYGCGCFWFSKER